MTKHKDKPFALIGVNPNGYDSRKLKEVMVKEKLNWRSVSDQGDIAERWNAPGTPMYYVIDRRGIIRYKWTGYPGEHAIDSALEKVIREAETGVGKPPR